MMMMMTMIITMFPRYTHIKKRNLSIFQLHWMKRAEQTHRRVWADEDGEAGEMTDVTWRMCCIRWRHLTVLWRPIATAYHSHTYRFVAAQQKAMKSAILTSSIVTVATSPIATAQVDQLYSPGGTDMHRHGSFGPHESTFQTGLLAVQPFSQSTTVPNTVPTQTDRQTQTWRPRNVRHRWQLVIQMLCTWYILIS